MPRPLPVLPGLVQSQQRGLATTKRASPRGTKRSPCWHSSSSLLAASGRLGGAASGRHHVVIFMKRNPTKCNRRFMSVLGCAPASLHPTYDYSMPDSQADCRAPFRYFRVSCSPAAGARKDKLRPVTAPSAMRSLRDPLPMSNMLSGPEQYGKGSWQSAFPDQLSKGTLRRKKLQGRSHKGCFAMPRPLPAVPNIVQLRQRGLAKTNPGRSQHALFRASCVTRCAVAARPFANEQYAFRLRAVWQRVVAVCPFDLVQSRFAHSDQEIA
jgi:hypothetical protein